MILKNDSNVRIPGGFQLNFRETSTLSDRWST